MHNVLFIEDEKKGVFSYLKHLERRGFHCELAKDGDEAIQKLQNGKFDILSLDVMFDPGRVYLKNKDPRRSGLQLLELIRSSEILNCNPDMNVIVLTAVASQEIEYKMRELGVFDYLKKPMPFDDVIERFVVAAKEGSKQEAVQE